MNKFYGKVGYSYTEETSPGVWTDVEKEVNYYGEITKTISKWNTSGMVNDNRDTYTQISIVADEFAHEHFYAIKWIEYMGVKWKVTQVEPLRPRLILTIGGIWNGEQA